MSNGAQFSPTAVACHTDCVRLTWKTVPFLLRRSVLAAFDDNCFSIAKGAAYSALLSFFPVLTSAATILVQTRAEFVSKTLERFVYEVVPPGTEEVVIPRFQVAGARPVHLLVFAGLVSLWAASSVIKSLIEGFQAAYRVPRNRAFLHGSGVAIALVLAAAVPLVGASVLVLFGRQVEVLVLRWMAVEPGLTPYAWIWQWISILGRYVVAFSAIILVTSLLYYFGPYRRQQWRAVLPGAVVATALWMLATMAFGWYVRNLAHYNVLYGSIGSSIALVVWMYVMAAIALVGCEFNAEWERLKRV